MKGQMWKLKTRKIKKKKKRVVVGKLVARPGGDVKMKF
jgi:hypothetical protein